jgi:hypothetical protein
MDAFARRVFAPSTADVQESLPATTALGQRVNSVGRRADRPTGRNSAATALPRNSTKANPKSRLPAIVDAKFRDRVLLPG